MDFKGVLRFSSCICVSRIDVLIYLILHEAHSSRYSIYPSISNIYGDLRQHYWWSGMKNDTVDFVARCLYC